MAAQQASLNIRHVDLPELRETFADSVHTVVWDGQTLRIELGVTRVQATATAGQTEATRYPSCRLVLSAAAATDLANRLQQTIAAVKAGGQPKAPPSGNAAGSSPVAASSATQNKTAKDAGGTRVQGRPSHPQGD